MAARERSRAVLRGEQRGYQLAQLRKNTGLTQAQVAAVMGVSQARVSQIKHGKVTEVDAIRGTSRPSAGQSTSWPASATGQSRSLEPEALSWNQTPCVVIICAAACRHTHILGSSRAPRCS